MLDKNIRLKKASGFMMNFMSYYTKGKLEIQNNDQRVPPLIWPRKFLASHR